MYRMRIRDIREDNNYNQTKIAKILGIKQNSYSQIEVGKNNLQNNEVTFTIGKGGDIWIHAKSYHGAHIVIKGTPPSDIIEKAASVAAYYSSGNSADKVEVDYTLRKYVKKIPSAMPGMVTYSNYNSVLVKPIDYIEIKDKE